MLYKRWADKSGRDVRIDPALNKALWAKGIKNPPRKVRVRLNRKRNEDEEASEMVR